MKDAYLILAEGLEKAAAGYRALADGDNDADLNAADAVSQNKNSIKIEDVRAVLAEKSMGGKTREIKALLMKYDAGKLSGVKPEDYEALLKEAEAL